MQAEILPKPAVSGKQSQKETEGEPVFPGAFALPVAYSGQSYLRVSLLQRKEQSNYCITLHLAGCRQITLVCEVLYTMY